MATSSTASEQTTPTDEKSRFVDKPSVTNNDALTTILYSAAKKIAIVGSIYAVGYMGWSVAWLIGPVILSVVRDQIHKTNAERRNIAKVSALANEKDVICARISELPAWVYFPDVERCEWLNKILKQVWPNANHYARTLVKETIEPNVAEALSNYKLSGFRFDRIILGSIPPRIGGVKVYDKNVDRNELIMDLDLFYASDCDINFYLGGMKGGIKDFQIHGLVRVVMKPLISTMPLVGGLQIFFLNNPTVDFNLVGALDLLDMPGLSDVLRKVIVEQIAAIMVLPNKLPITLSDQVPQQLLKMPEPEGVLRIHVVEAKDLMKKDIGVLGKGKSDPYAIIKVGAQEFRTQTIDNNVNPKWDYWCEGTVYAILGQEVEFNLWDCDQGLPIKGVQVQADDYLGRATVEISNVVKNGVLDTWLTLEEAKHGLLHVRLTWYKLSDDKEDLAAVIRETQLLRVTSMSAAVLNVFIDSAKNLPHPRGSQNPDPYLIISVGKQTEQTPGQLRTDSPVWEKGYSFLVGNPDNDTLQLKIMDQKTGGELGRYTYILSSIISKEGMKIVSQPFQLLKSGPESKIIMSLSLQILKRSELAEGDNLSISSEMNVGGLSRSISVKTTGEEDNIKGIENLIKEEPIREISLAGSLAALPKMSPVNEANLGSIHLSLQYSVPRQRLVVTVHKITNIPLTDPSNIPDPYVKLYLLPARSKESKRKTNVIKDNCNPVYEDTFEYIISSGELMTTELEITVCTQKGFLYGGSPIIGMVKIALAEPQISLSGLSKWWDLLPENKMHSE